MEHQQLTDAEFAEFQKLIFQLCGIQVPANKVMLLSNRIRRRLRATGTAGYADYLRLLKTRAGNDELAHFLDAITTAWGGHVTTSLESYIDQRSSYASNQLVYSGLANPCTASINETSVPNMEWNVQVDLLGRKLTEIPTNQVFIERSTNGLTRKRVVLP